MRVFVCYARDDVRLAEAVAIRLRKAGHSVFFDRTKLEPGRDFDLQIRDALRRCDYLIFLASRAAVADGAYARTELEIFKRRFPQPEGRVLTVLRPDADRRQLPSYLGAVSALETEGDVVAHATHVALEAIERLARPRRRAWLAIVTAIAMLTGGFALWPPGGRPKERQFELVRSSFSKVENTAPKHEGEFVVRAWFATNLALEERQLSIRFEDTDFRARTAHQEIVVSEQESAHELQSFFTIMNLHPSRQVRKLEDLRGKRWRLACQLAGEPTESLHSAWQVVGDRVETPKVHVLESGRNARDQLERLGETATVFLVLGEGLEQKIAANVAALSAQDSPRRKVVWCKTRADLVSYLKPLWKKSRLAGKLSDCIACCINDGDTLSAALFDDEKVTAVVIRQKWAEADSK